MSAARLYFGVIPRHNWKMFLTKDSDTARAPWELFVRRGFRWKLMHDPKFESSRNRAKRGLDILEEPDRDEFAAMFHEIRRDGVSC